MSHHPDNPPEWYWINGLHDAGIMGVEAFEFPFDYNKFVGEKSKYNRNLLVFLFVFTSFRHLFTRLRQKTITDTAPRIRYPLYLF